MKKKMIYILCLMFILPLTANAQGKKATKTKKKAKVAMQEENSKFTAMLGATAKVFIIDSVVVDSADYLNAIYTNKEEGQVTTYNRFFKSEGNGIVYINELGTKCLYSKIDEASGHKMLYQSDLLSDGWTQGEPLDGIDESNGLYDFDYPYLMPDGTTLYFSARGNDALGGYDIYRTRLAPDGKRFLKPENLGLPFNSEQDDYMYVIDEQNQLAYFASNRRQPGGKTCVYTFIPSETRTTVSGDDEKVRSLARIDRIADTWENHSELETALNRKRAASIQDKGQAKQKGESFSFRVNDQTVYTSLSDFRVLNNRTRMKELLSLKNQLAELETSLSKQRNSYTTASSLERQSQIPQILKAEQQVTALYKQIHQLEKTIRSTENQ